MNTLIAFLESVPRLFGRIAGWLTVVLVVVIGYDVGTRKFIFIQEMVSNSFLYDFMSPTKLQELEWHLLAAIFLFSLGWAYLENTHIRVDILREHMAPHRKARVELAGLLLLAIPYFATMLWFSWDYVQSAFVSNEGSASLTGIPKRWIIKSTLLIGFSCLLMAMFAIALRLLRRMRPPDKSVRTSPPKPDDPESQQQIFHLQ